MTRQCGCDTKQRSGSLKAGTCRPAGESRGLCLVSEGQWQVPLAYTSDTREKFIRCTTNLEAELMQNITLSFEI